MDEYLQLFRKHKAFSKYTDEQLLNLISYIIGSSTETDNKVAVKEWIEGNKKSPYLNDLIDQLYY